VNLALDFVGNQQNHDVRARGDFPDRSDHEAILILLGPLTHREGFQT
jgi:hypothetical protein